MKEKASILLEGSDSETRSEEESNQMVTSTPAKRIVEEKEKNKKSRNRLKVGIEQS